MALAMLLAGERPSRRRPRHFTPQTLQLLWDSTRTQPKPWKRVQYNLFVKNVASVTYNFCALDILHPNTALVGESLHFLVYGGSSYGNARMAFFVGRWCRRAS